MWKWGEGVIDILAIILKKIEKMMESEAPSDRKELYILNDSIKDVFALREEENNPVSPESKIEIFERLIKHYEKRILEVEKLDFREPECWVHELPALARGIVDMKRELTQLKTKLANY